MSDKCGNIPEPNNLKHCLQLLGKLSTLGQLKDSVIKQLKNELEWYCDKGSQYINEFQTKYIGTTFDNANQLLGKILKEVEYGYYKNLKDNEHTEHTECITSIVHIITTMMSKVYAAIYYLYFNASNECSGIQGNQWGGMKVDGSEGSGQKNLHHWLVDQTGLTPSLLTRGFGGDLSSKDATELATSLRDLVNHKNAASFQNALLGMLFICPWDHSLTGHGCVLLDKFCEKVAQDGEKIKSRFSELNLPGDFTNFKNACQTLKTHLKSFLDGDDTMIQAVSQEGSTGLYSTFWHVDKFKDYFTNYIIWLKDHLPSVIASLQNMPKDCTTWDKGNLKSARSAGPFTYGFVFKDRNWEGQMQDKLKEPIQKLIGSLTCLYLSIFQPKDLKHSLQLFGRLKDKDTLKSQVIEKLKGQLEKYCYKSSSYMGSQLENQYLDETFDKTVWVLGKILKNSVDVLKYGPYANLQNSDHKQCNCVQSIIQTIIDMLPQAYVALYYLYFQVSGKTSAIQGGGWKDHRVTQIEQNLAKFLIDHSSMNRLGLMPRGFFKSELNTFSRGSNLAKHLEDLIGHEDAQPLQNALVGFLFLGPWNDSKLGHAVLFLNAFCGQVNDNDNTLRGTFTKVVLGGDFTNFKNACQTLKTHLKSFLDGDDTMIQAVCHSNNTLYSNLWKNGQMDEEEFKGCFEWLQQNLYNIITVLKSMSEDCVTWTALYLKYSLSPGPFRYGFVFKGTWNGDPLKEKLQNLIQKLIDSNSGPIVKLMEELQPKAAAQSQPDTLTPILTGVGGTVVGAGAGYFLGPTVISGVMSLL